MLKVIIVNEQETEHNSVTGTSYSAINLEWPNPILNWPAQHRAMNTVATAPYGTAKDQAGWNGP